MLAAKEYIAFNSAPVIHQFIISLFCAYILTMKNTMLLALFLFAANATAVESNDLSTSRDVNGIRFDLHRTSVDSYALIARGRSEQSAEEVQAAFLAQAKELCNEPAVADPLQRGEYEFLVGGNHFLMPVGGAFLPMTEYNVVKRAHLISGSIRCSSQLNMSKPMEIRRAVRVAISSNLGETFPYIDQGFASFNRERLDVPLSDASFTRTISDAVKRALEARGFQVELVSGDSAGDVKVEITKASVPGERFDGLAMLTKIGLLGIKNLSAAFCSVNVALISSDSGNTLSLGGVSTREMMPAIYSNWKQDMSNGPTANIHAKTSAVLLRTLSINVGAAIHAMPTPVLESAFAVRN